MTERANTHKMMLGRSPTSRNQENNLIDTRYKTNNGSNVQFIQYKPLGLNYKEYSNNFLK
ncbi:hypothetical protein MTR_6g006840 [Medicago truncatula]|uniref:Uncharacterized protein n=1 Tax=Medicago truncatula TaxID=3880 RepID=G7KI85_MEDTR|nr:hypothetical protein MTR_6g006840 [Medicago truncatula]